MAIGIGIGLGFGGSGAWSPSRLGPLGAGWWRSDMGITLAAPATARARWLDLSANKYFVGQDTASKRPTLSGGALSFDATANQCMARAALAGFDDGYTCGVAHRIRALPAAVRVLATNGANGGNGIEVYITAGNLRGINHPGVAAVSWGAATTNPETWVARHDGVGGQADFCLNGAHQAPLALGNNVAPTVSFALADRVATGTALNVDVYAVVVYSDRKSDAVVDKLSAYLTARRNGVAPPAGWVPSDEANLVLWLEQPTIYAGQCVTAWADQSGLGRHLAQATAANQLVWLPSGGPNNMPYLHADGVNDNMRGTWAQTQPLHRFAMALPSVALPLQIRYIADGGAVVKCALLMPASGTQISIHAGTQLSTNCAIRSWHRFDAQYNGASSSVRVDDAAPAAGNAGVANSDGLILAARGDVSDYSDLLISELFDANVILGADDETKAQAYLTARYGI